MSHYTLKESPYSSHSLLLSHFPGSEASASRQSVLDVGCANGEFARLIAARGYRVTGVERPGGFNDKFPKEVRLIPADLEGGLPTLDGPYDRIVCADILEHLRDPASLLRQLRTHLKPGGRLIASLPNSGNIYFRLVVLSGNFPQDEKGLFDRTHVRFFTWAGWRSLLTTSGWRIDSVQVSGIPVGLKFPNHQDTAAIKAAEWASYQFARLRKRLFAYQFIVTAVPS